jgi:ATP-binding cassette subfamily F protein uup
MIAGLEHSDGGELWVNSSAKIIYLPQQPDLNEENTVLEQVFADSGEQMSLVKEYEEISDKLTHGHGDMDRLLEQLSRVSERMDQTGAWDLETNAKIVLTKLGIDDLEAKIGSLSGGYRKRIAIASALLSAPDVLLMDEPTNHLDALSVEWLQSYLNRYRGALLLITHDRYFLDRVTNRIIEIDRGDLYSYSGNYYYYLVTPTAKNLELLFKEAKTIIDFYKTKPYAQCSECGSFYRPSYNDINDEETLMKAVNIMLIDFIIHLYLFIYILKKYQISI